MKMSELSERSGVAVPTIKYYLREGVLPAGRRDGPTQASYDETHLDRLGLIRALVEVGRVSVAGVGELVTALESGTELGPLLGVAQRLVTAAGERAGEPWRARAAEIADVEADGPCGVGVEAAARALQGMERADRTPSPAWTAKYWAAAQLMAEADLDEVAARDGDLERARLVVVGTPLGDVLAGGLRRIAQTREAMRRYPGAVGAAPGQSVADHVPDQRR